MNKTYSTPDRNAAALHLAMAKLASLYGQNDARPPLLGTEEHHRSTAHFYTRCALNAHTKGKEGAA